MLQFLKYCFGCLSLTIIFCSGSIASASQLTSLPDEKVWKLATDLKIKRQDKGGFRDLFLGKRALTVGGGLYVIASCTGEDDHVTNLISLSGSGKMEVSDPNSGPSACGYPSYDISVQGTNPFTVTYRVHGLTQKIGIINFTIDLDKAVTPLFAFLHKNQKIEEGCANDWRPMDAKTTKVADIRAPCIIPHDVGAVGVARQTPPLFNQIEAFLGNDNFRIQTKIVSVKVTDSKGSEVKLGNAAFASDFGIYNHPGTHAFGSAFFGLPQDHSIELKQSFRVLVR